MNINAILEKDFSQLTEQDWEELRTYLRGERPGPSKTEDLKARLTAAVGDWEKFSQVIVDTLNS